MKSKSLGARGYYGLYTNPACNDIVKELNKLVDEYNSKINSFKRYEEQVLFIADTDNKTRKMLKDIDKILLNSKNHIPK
jgi:multidrug efflux pump subunit AcrB